MFNPDFSSAIKVIDKSTSKTGTIFEVIEYIKPRNGSIFNAAVVPSTYQQLTGEKLRQVRISINNSGIIAQPGALQFMKGPIKILVQPNAPSSSKGFFNTIRKYKLALYTARRASTCEDSVFV